MKGKLRIGVDFDNTIASYDELVHRVAVERGLIDTGVPANKQVVRDRVRQGENGEQQWQLLQGIVYGPRMAEAQLVAGTWAFFRRCQERGIPVFIVSHKTEYANFDPTRTPLREVALSWMESKGFFSPAGLGLSRNEVYFAATRQEKIACIRQLACTHFVDDLEEVFREPGFPCDTKKILLARQSPAEPLADLSLAPSWAEVSSLVFAACA